MEIIHDSSVNLKHEALTKFYKNTVDVYHKALLKTKENPKICNVCEKIIKMYDLTEK